MAEREIYNEQTGQYEFADDGRVDTPYTRPPMQPVKTAAEIEEERRRYNQQHPPKQRPGYQNVWNDRTGEWEEHSTVPEVPNNPADRPPVTPPVTPPGGKTPAQIEAEGRADDERNNRTGGYMSNGVWVNGSPRGTGGGSNNPPRTTTPPPASGGYPGGGGYAPGQSSFPMFEPSMAFTPPDPFTYAEYEAAQPFSYADYEAAQPFSYADYEAPQPFAYEAFEAPTGTSMLSDPSYQFRLQEGQRALENSAAAKGLTRTGAQMKGLQDYSQQFASQEYGNLYNRAQQQYGQNRENATQQYAMNEANRKGTYQQNLGLAQSTAATNEAERYKAYMQNFGKAVSTYGTNESNRADAYKQNLGLKQDIYASAYKTADDTYTKAYQAAKDMYAPKQKAAELQYGREWDVYKLGQEQQYKYWKDRLDADTAIADYGTRNNG